MKVPIHTQASVLDPQIVELIRAELQLLLDVRVLGLDCSLFISQGFHLNEANVLVWYRNEILPFTIHDIKKCNYF
jgi:hypothetical protein